MDARFVPVCCARTGHASRRCPPAACGPPGPLAPESVLFAAQIRRFCRPRDRTASPRAQKCPRPCPVCCRKIGGSVALGTARLRPVRGELPSLSCLLSQSRGSGYLRRRCAKPSADPLLLCKARNFGLRHGFENPVVGVMERKFGTVGAVAFAFIFGFLPRPAVQIKEIQI